MSKSTTKASEAAKANETAKPSGKAADGAEKAGQEMQTAEKEKAGQETQTADEKPSGNPGGEAVYSIEELTASSETALGVPRECAAAAFKKQKKEGLSLSEAKEIVEKFMKSEVK